MAAKTIQIPINAASFPFIHAQASRTVAESTDLAPRMPGAFYGSITNAEFSVPQLIYCENVMPAAAKLFSVGYGTQVDSITPAVTDFDQVIILRDVNERQFVFSPGGGKNYLLDPNTNTWSSLSPFTFTQTLVTHAYVNGRTFVCYEKTKILEYDSGTGLLNTVTLTLPGGVTISDIRGIGGASNYLLLFTDLTVYWSTPANVLDFANVDQGAGQQTPTDVKGQITALMACPGGFIVYTARNAVGATFTNNAAAPFIFREIGNAGGIPTWERCTTSIDGPAGHYVFGTAGLQKVTLAGAETLHPEATDFLTGNQYEVWNSVTKSVDLSVVSTSFSVKMAFLTNRYLVISYGVKRFEFDDALVLDTALNRWGRLHITHTDCFMYAYPTMSGSYFYSELPGLYTDLGELTYEELDTPVILDSPPKRGIAFLGSNGQVRILATDFAQSSASGVAIFGRLQQNRQRLTTLTGLEVDGIRSGSVTLLPSETGLSRDAAVAMTLAEKVGDYARYEALETAKNFHIAVEGAFLLSNLQARVMNHGYR